MIPDILIILFILAIIILPIVLLIRYTKKVNRRKTELFKSLGLKFNLRYSEQKYLLRKLNVLTGDIDGHVVDIYEKIVGSGKHQQLHTVISFQPNPFDFEFRIAKENLFSKIGKKFGGKDIEFDNFEFDKTFLLKSKDEAKFRAMMDFRVQESLMRLQKSLHGSIMSTKSEFTYHIIGGFTKEVYLEQYEAVFNFMRLLLKNKR